MVIPLQAAQRHEDRYALELMPDVDCLLYICIAITLEYILTTARSGATTTGVSPEQ
jgi:hypothetical protein